VGAVAHYSDWAIVALFLPGSAPWMCHRDPEVRLKNPFDWVSPSINLMKEDSRVAVANPNWWKGGLDGETILTHGDFSIGYRFNDQVYLLRISEFARPVFRYFAPASLRDPLSYVSPIFEQRVDAYMRCHRRLRATYRRAIYVHPDNENSSCPIRLWKDTAKRMILRSILAVVDKVPIDGPGWKINPKHV